MLLLNLPLYEPAALRPSGRLVHVRVASELQFHMAGGPAETLTAGGEGLCEAPREAGFRGARD